MTSSDPAPAPAPARVIAQGHLHPGMLFLRLLDGVRGALVPALLAALTRQPWLLAAVGMLFVLSLAFALARYLTFEYRLTEEELVTTEGILHRQERRIPIDRIQDLSFESTIVRRACGLVVVSVETASSHGAEAKLDSLARRDAERLREALYQVRGLRGGAARQPSAAMPVEVPLYAATAGDLFWLGLTDNRLGVVLAAIFGALELVNELQLGNAFSRVVQRALEALAVVSPLIAALALAGVVLMGLVLGWVVAIATTFLLFHGFALSERAGVFQRRYGLLTARAASLPRRRIQRVLLEQNWLRRMLGLTVVRADSAGSGMDPREQTRGGRDVVAPLASLARAEPLVPVLLPALVPWALQWQPTSPRLILRVTLKGAFLTAAVLAAAVPPLGAWGLAGLVVLPMAWIVGVLSYRNLAFAEPEGHLALRYGVLGLYRSFVPLGKVQAIVVERNPLDRLLGLSQLTVYVAGGSPTTLANLPAEQASVLQERLVRQAARARFVW